MLAIETSTECCSVALFYQDTLYTRQALAPRQHAQRVFDQLDAVFAESGCQKTHITGLILGAGPGSFTGLRVSASVIQALLASLHCPVVRISSLQAMAEQAYRTQGLERVLAVLDARMQEVYWGVYQYDVLLGHMVNVIPDQVSARPDPGPQFTELPLAQDLIKPGLAKLQQGDTLSPDAALPWYIRNKVTG